ncbi:MerR family transcriptional regulator [Metabacillus herbersteinensis]|uniref:Chromosome-anchoring protein RacA n=1 Tax=Metabacillus herbersteinensis TaxID=283816 RepID=A0ABV6GFI4_9BACI
MNTATVAKILGVSPKTVQRWVKQLSLQMERNELGHYLFSEQDVDRLKKVQQQLSEGILLQEIVVQKPATRQGTTRVLSDSDREGVKKLASRLDEIERKVNSKADAVVSYQLLQHRREMEELLEKINRLEEKVELLESQPKSQPKDNILVFDHRQAPKKTKRKNLISSLFSF